jgi:hypothetical protein
VAGGFEWSWGSVLSGVVVGPNLRGSGYHSLRDAVLDAHKALVAARSVCRAFRVSQKDRPQTPRQALSRGW